MLRQAAVFGLVGAAATLVHLLVGTYLIGRMWNPFLANTVGFATAFWISFTGHGLATFKDHASPVPRALGRMLLVTGSGFAGSQMLFAALLFQGVMPETTALMISTLLIAAVNFVLTKRWVFAGVP